MNFEVMYYKDRKGHWMARVNIKSVQYSVGPYAHFINACAMVGYMTGASED